MTGQDAAKRAAANKWRLWWREWQARTPSLSWRIGDDNDLRIGQAIGAAVAEAVAEKDRECEHAHGDLVAAHHRQAAELARLRAAVTEADRLTDEALTGLIDIREALSYFQKIKVALCPGGAPREGKR